MTIVKRLAACGGVLLSFAAGYSLVPTKAAARLALSPQNAQTQDDHQPVPAFHTEVPKDALPATLSPDLFNNAIVQNAYARAAHVKRVLYQQPCYCYCDRSQGHGSLLDCFAGKHAAECGTCLREGLYAYEQTKKGKTAAQIRAAIEHGDWQQVDLTKYQTPVTTK
jgi:hypothetical protein